MYRRHRRMADVLGTPVAHHGAPLQARPGYDCRFHIHGALE